MRMYLIEQTNLYSMQETGKSISVTEDEIEIFWYINGNGNCENVTI